MKEFDLDLVNKISTELNIEKITAKCLLSCGFTSVEECQKFLNPSLEDLSPVELYDGFNAVKNRIQSAIDNNEKVLIYGDYDCDGVCSTSMLYLFLTSKGVETYYYIPDRHQDGYGMNIDSLEEIMEEYLPDLIITVDCGITSCEEVDYIHEALGCDVVITDHHKPQDALPNCDIFNPHLSNDEVFRDLCGAGVVLRLIEGLSSREESLQYYDLAAIATVADIVPMLNDNRVIVKKGLELLNSKPRYGVKELIKSLGKETIDSTDIAFRIAPRINAVGRLENANRLIDLFKYDDPFVVTSLVEEINELNTKRQDQTRKIVEQVQDSLENYDFEQYPIIVVKGKNWDDGIIGIVAARIVADYNHPAIVMNENGDEIKGSGRSLPTVNIFECVNASSSILSKFGGHPQACGITLQKENFDLFKKIINEYCKEHYSNDCYKKDYSNVFDFHEIVNIQNVTRELNMLQPFGEKNPKPIFEANVKNIGFSRMKPGSTHIQYKKKNFQMVGFGMADRLAMLNSDIEKKLIFSLDENIYNNIIYSQAQIRDLLCFDTDSELAINYVKTALFDDKSVFKPKSVSFEEAMKMTETTSYGTAYLCFSKSTYSKVVEINSTLQTSSYILTTKCPNNAVYFCLNQDEDLTSYSNVVFMDRPLSLGYIDILKLNKDCNVFYIDADCAKDLNKYLVDYKTLGKIYVEIVNRVSKMPNIDIYSLYIDIEKILNVNYNNFVVALYIFIDLGLLNYEEERLLVNRNVKNPITNSKLYKKILGEK